jgi:hypothetical protein
MGIRTIAAAGFAALAALTASASVPTAAASAPAVAAARVLDAGQGVEDCPPGYYCLYEYRGFNIRYPDGKVWIYKRAVDDLGSENDRASSVVNNMDEPVHLYRHWAKNPETGTCLQVLPHRQVYDLGLYTLDDQITSTSLSQYPCF